VKLPSDKFEGALPLERILRVLHDHQVAILKDGSGTRLEKGDVLEATLFTPIVPRWIIQRLSYLFDIDITDFYYMPEQGGFLGKDDGEDD
jgi:hypothetical protein